MKARDRFLLLLLLFLLLLPSSPTLYHHQTSLYLAWASPSWQLKIQMAFSYSGLIIYFRAHDYGIIFFFFFSLSFGTQTNKTTCPLHMQYLFKNTSHNSGIITKVIITKVIITKVSKNALASHSSTHAWKIPWTEEPGGLQSMGSLRVRYNWVTSLSLFTFMRWRRKWQPTPVFLPGESQGRGSLVGFRLCGYTESDTTEVT